MAAKLNQIIAVEKGVKSSSFQDLTDSHHMLQKPSLPAGTSFIIDMSSRKQPAA